MIELDRYIRRFESFKAGLCAITEGLTADEARFKPTPADWSILEIVCHLADEEVEDFRTRLQLTLEEPTRQWPPIDPEGWAVQRRYNHQDLAAAVARFAAARQESLAWLRSLDHPDWSRTHHHPKLGPMSAGDLLVSWAAHDALHLRQFAKRLHQLAERDSDGHSSSYAGSWGP
ncbi:MAG: DinB family protein [Planctomycetes bacterium]|nr:DinB family protein [Planctomycetota bacterium]